MGVGDGAAVGGVIADFRGGGRTGVALDYTIVTTGTYRLGPSPLTR